MKSPITGREMPVKKRKEKFEFRKETFEITYHYYLDEASGDQFTDDHLSEINTNQLYNEYRSKYGIPYPDEIIALREKYGLSANKMSEVLGFGINVYRAYEAGEVPSASNGKFLQQIKKTEFFLSVLESSSQFTAEELEKIHKKIETAINGWRKSEEVYESFLCGNKMPNEYTGYRIPSLDKIANMILYFAQKVQPYKTKLNKLLFYADFLHFRDTVYSISGATYKAIQMGPVPKNFGALFDYAIERKFVDIELIQFEDFVGERFVPVAGVEFNKDLFEDSELLVLEIVARKFADTTVKEIVNISHNEAGWKDNIGGFSPITYKYSFDLIEM
ncbi:DUF4065 domain-containing protein [Chitinophaga oryziterrae]|uniref:DUF4065 domain-containing protein n=1 Tax=Chitinophaga oryziterrae TaxID=1031224 RepID=A0A6N8J6G7_9BACT|nr:type II toxin-antitoxin system antitoxin SocA domain-containing protein [Chitinophaga oryziterrae]MVT40827.1 DUF4065 domain-containing protein [Chitinophaga oryziterrae]